MGSKAFPHVILRRGWYHYHRRVPTRVIASQDAFELLFQGQPLYRRALRTKTYGEALREAAEVEQEFDALVARALGKQQVALAGRPSRPLTANALGEIAAYVCSQIVRQWRAAIIRSNVDAEAADYLDWLVESYVGDRDGGDKYTALLAGVTVREKAAALNGEWGFNVAASSDDFAELVAAVKDGCTEAIRSVNDLFAGKALPDQPTSSLMKSFATRADTPKTKRFSEVTAEHMKANRFAAKTLAKMHRSHELFIKIVGDKPVGEIARVDVHAFLDALAEQQVGKGGAAARNISRATVQSYLTQITSPLDFAIGRGWLAEPSPAAGIRVAHWVAPTNPQQQSKRRRFELSELNALFAHPWFAGCAGPDASYQAGDTLLDDMRYWAPVIALYTGARAGELGGLRLEEVVIDDPSPHILIRCNGYRNTKSKMDRHVPILDALLELGLREYVERIRSTGSDRLFPDWKLPPSNGADSELFNWANTKSVRAFNRTVIPAALPHVAAVAGRSPVVFHSLRGAFKVLLLNSGPRHLANAILGHLQDDYDKAYVGMVTPAETYAAFHAVDFTGLKVPTRAASRGAVHQLNKTHQQWRAMRFWRLPTSRRRPCLRFTPRPWEELPGFRSASYPVSPTISRKQQFSAVLAGPAVTLRVTLRCDTPSSRPPPLLFEHAG